MGAGWSNPSRCVPYWHFGRKTNFESDSLFQVRRLVIRCKNDTTPGYPSQLPLRVRGLRLRLPSWQRHSDPSFKILLREDGHAIAGARLLNNRP